jgi:hypothetical protein
VEIDSHKQDREHVPTLSIEATLFDNSGLSNSIDADLSYANAVNLKPKPKPTRSPCRGSHGYVLGGKIENPKLWSSEHVRDIITPGKFYYQTLLLQFNCIKAMSFNYSSSCNSPTYTRLLFSLKMPMGSLLTVSHAKWAFVMWSWHTSKCLSMDVLLY